MKRWSLFRTRAERIVPPKPSWAETVALMQDRQLSGYAGRSSGGDDT